MKGSVQLRTRPSRVWVLALRLPFLGASALPFLAGAVMAPASVPRFPATALLGFVAVATGHLCANVANDIADTDAGVDALDPVPHGFFGGSKVICAGWLPRTSVVRCAGFLGAACMASVAALAALSRSLLPVAAAVLALGLALAYSLPPLRLGGRGWGEVAVGLLFGPVTVVAGYWSRCGLVPPPAVLRMGLVAGFLAASVLLANEVPDADCDARAGKRTLVVRTGVHRGWLLYGISVAVALGLLASGPSGWISTPALVLALLAGALPAGDAAARLRRVPADKRLLRAASARAILAQSAVLLVFVAERSL